MAFPACRDGGRKPRRRHSPSFLPWKMCRKTGANGILRSAERNACPRYCSSSGTMRSCIGPWRLCNWMSRSLRAWTSWNGRVRGLSSSDTAPACKRVRYSPVRWLSARCARTFRSVSTERLSAYAHSHSPPGSLPAALGSFVPRLLPRLPTARQYRHLEPLFQHHVGSLESAFHPALRIRVSLATDVDRRVRGLQDVLLHVRTAHTDIPGIPAAAEGVVAPVFEARVLHSGNELESVNRCDLALDLGHHRGRRLVVVPLLRIRIRILPLRLEPFHRHLLVVAAPVETVLRTEAVPEADVQTIVITGHQHRAAGQSGLPVVLGPIVGLADRQIGGRPTGLDPGGQPPWLHVGREDLEQRPRRDAPNQLDHTLLPQHRAVRRQQVQRAPRHRQDELPGPHRLTAAEVELDSAGNLVEAHYRPVGQDLATGRMHALRQGERHLLEALPEALVDGRYAEVRKEPGDRVGGVPVAERGLIS